MSPTNSSSANSDDYDLALPFLISSAGSIGSKLDNPSLINDWLYPGNISGTSYSLFSSIISPMYDSGFYMTGSYLFSSAFYLLPSSLANYS